MSSVKPQGKSRDLTYWLLLVVCINAISAFLDRLFEPKENVFESRIIVQGMYGSTLAIAGRDLVNTEV